MSAFNMLGTGRTALVTGASRGIGPLIAREVASQGGHVVLTGRSGADRSGRLPLTDRCRFLRRLTSPSALHELHGRVRSAVTAS